MKKLVIKTVAITIAAIVFLTTAVYFLMAFVSPKVLADSWKAVGNYTFSVKYYEKQYQKSKSLEDLASLCANLDAKNDSARSLKYFVEFTGNEGFSDYCKREDEKAQGGFKSSAYEYYYGRYTISAYYVNGIDSAVSISKKAFSSNYTEYNSFYVLLLEVETLSSGEGQKISSEVTAIKSRLSDAKQREYAQRDIELANSIT